MSICIKPSNKLADHQVRRMFDLYVKTYSVTGQQLWFTSAEQLLYYPCAYIINCNGEEAITAFIMFQFRSRANKISLICHDGSAQAKQEILNLVVELLNKSGWILEASGAVSWVLRKLGRAPIIMDPTRISTLLDIKTRPEERIVMNPHFDHHNKFSNAYYHEYYKDGIVQFKNEETLFGTGVGCKYDGENCSRHCIEKIEETAAFKVKLLPVQK